jgi:4-diphosphocytidyl-2-C-methyl-D-erythritol kinase
MLVFPNAKINLGLRVIRTRHDGYHDIESLFYPLALRDVLEILPVAGNEATFLKISGSDIPGNEQNLCNNAVNQLRLRHAFPEVGMYLQKSIPVGAGLGGGSADGAFTLKCINDLFRLNLSQQALLEHAGNLGSDCPFFIINTPSLVTGRGEILKPVSPCLRGYYIMLVVPNLKVDTSNAYKMVHVSSKGEKVSDIIKLRPENWQGRLLNYFEGPLFSEYPELRAIKDRLYDTGALYASMTGSGSGMFGIYSSFPAIPNEFHRYFVHREKLA